MPQIWLLLALRYHPARVNRARRERDVIANGQFILMPREATRRRAPTRRCETRWRRTWRWRRPFTARAERLHFAFAERLMETRMYRGLRDLIEGWSKNIYLGGRRSFPDEPLLRALVPVMLVVAMRSGWCRRWCWRCTGGRARARRGRRRWRPGSSALFWMLIAHGMRIPPWYGLRYPLGALMALYIVRPVDLARRAQGGMERDESTDCLRRQCRSTTTSCFGIAPPSTRPSGSTLRRNSHVADGERSANRLPTGVSVPLTVCPPPRLKNGTCFAASGPGAAHRLLQQGERHVEVGDRARLGAEDPGLDRLPDDRVHRGAVFLEDDPGPLQPASP